jgi:hypothetical protein
LKNYLIRGGKTYSRFSTLIGKNIILSNKCTTATANKVFYFNLKI